MRPIDADDITATLEIAISMMENTKSIIGVENLPAIDVEIKAYTDILKGIKEQPTVQPERTKERRKAPEIVRCGECKHNGTHNCLLNLWATIFNSKPKDDFYCGMAERRTDD